MKEIMTITPSMIRGEPPSGGIVPLAITSLVFPNLLAIILAIFALGSSQVVINLLFAVAISLSSIVAYLIYLHPLVATLRGKIVIGVTSTHLVVSYRYIIPFSRSWAINQIQSIRLNVQVESQVMNDTRVLVANQSLLAESTSGKVSVLLRHELHVLIELMERMRALGLPVEGLLQQALKAAKSFFSRVFRGPK